MKKSSKGLLRKKTMKSQKIKDKKLSKMNILNQREEWMQVRIQKKSITRWIKFLVKMLVTMEVWGWEIKTREIENQYQSSRLPDRLVLYQSNRMAQLMEHAIAHPHRVKVTSKQSITKKAAMRIINMDRKWKSIWIQ